MSKIRVAMITNDLNNNGISNVVINYSININKSIIEISIIAGTPINTYFKEQCDYNDIKLIELPERKKHARAYYKALYAELSSKKYDVVHVHGNSATISVELFIARMKGIGVRIAHCHNCTCNNLRIHKILLPLFNSCYTHGFACSSSAGDWLFEPNTYKILPNGFNVSKFRFDNNMRVKMRNELGLDNKFVIGTVARFNSQKNHPYLLKVFDAVADEREDAYLLLVGDGPDLEKIKGLIAEHPHRDRIIYYGETNHVEYIYDAIDIFVLPSKYEGLGIVFIEAQINGLPVVTSGQVPSEVNIGGRTEFLELTENTDTWKKVILDVKSVDRSSFYEQYYDEIKIYDIERNARNLEDYYVKYVNR